LVLATSRCRKIRTPGFRNLQMMLVELMYTTMELAMKRLHHGSFLRSCPHFQQPFA
jgi:hypothetical protein